MKNLILIPTIILFSASAFSKNFSASLLDQIRDNIRLKFNTESVIVESFNNIESFKIGYDISFHVEMQTLDAIKDKRQFWQCSFLFTSVNGDLKPAALDCFEN
jgi:hypothetical protein